LVEVKLLSDLRYSVKVCKTVVVIEKFQV